MPRTPGAWEEEDEWYSDTIDGVRRVRRPSRGRIFLEPEERRSTHHHHFRAHSQSGPSGSTPHINIYNTVDDHQRLSATASPRQGSPGRGRTGGARSEEYDDLLALEELRIRARSRSRGPMFRESDPNYERMQLELANERLKERERERRDEEYKEQIRREYELRKEKDRYKREAKEREESEERKRILTEEQLKVERAQKARDDERRRVLAEEIARQDKAKRDAEELKDRTRAAWEREEREQKAERQRAIDQWEAKKRKEHDEAELEKKRVVAEYERRKIDDEKKAKEEEDAWRARIKLEDQLKKEREEKEYQEFLLKMEKKKEEEKRRKKEEEDKLQEEMTKRLMLAGFQNNQIQAIMKPELQENLQQGLIPAKPIAGLQPTYIKVRREHIAVETLTYFNIPWEYDHHDHEYIIILREMDQKDTDMLFEHTRHLRRGSSSTRLLIERGSDHDKTNYAWVRKRSKSPAGRRRSSPKRQVGIKEMFF